MKPTTAESAQLIEMLQQWIDHLSGATGWLHANRSAEAYREWLFFHDETEVCPPLTNQEMSTQIMWPKFGNVIPSF